MNTSGDTIKITTNDGVISGTFDFFALNSIGDTIMISVISDVIQGGTFDFYALDSNGDTIKLSVSNGIIIT
jgi:hypothetical protein